MNKQILLSLIFFLIFGCSFNKDSKFWSNTEIVSNEKVINFEEVYPKEESLKKEFNSDLKITLDNKKFNKNNNNYNHNKDSLFNYLGDLQKSSRYSFKKIKNFHQYEPEISFFENEIIFFDNIGSILRFNENSKLVWKKNYYNKSQKKLNPILQFANNGRFLVVADNIAKYYMIDINSGNLVWSKDNLAPFNSQIKIFKDKFFIVDFSNTLRCFSLKDGQELWNIKTENSLIRSQKKLSIVIDDKYVYFNNSIGDISAVDLNKGELIWQIPTQSSLIYESTFSLETSDIIVDKNYLFFSNNKNRLFSINTEIGSIAWENKINSNIRSVVIENYLFSISQEGYFIVTEKTSGNIIRVNDVFKNFSIKQRKNIKPTGFVVSKDKIFISTSNGKLLTVDINTGKTVSTLKISNNKISRPFVKNENLFLIKDNAIIKLN